MKVEKRAGMRIIFIVCSLPLVLVGCPQANLGYVQHGSVIFNIAGEYTWSVPEGVENVDVYMESCAGGGGGGGGGKDCTHSGSENGGNGGSGGSGCYLKTEGVYVGNVTSVKIVCPSSGAGGESSYSTGWWGGGGAGGGAGGAAVFSGIVLPGGTGGGGGCGGGTSADFGGDGGLTENGVAGGCVGNTTSHNNPSPSGIGAAYNFSESAGKGGKGQSASGSNGECVFKGSTTYYGICSLRNGGAGGSGGIQHCGGTGGYGIAGSAGTGGDGLVMIIY